MSIVVSDTSPIRVLAHLGHLELLRTLFREVLVPTAVVLELEQPRSRLPSLVVRSLAFVRVQDPVDRKAVRELRATLGPGEAEALVLAEEVHADAILIDEAAGRTAARDRGLRPFGALGLLVRARRMGLVEPLARLMDRLQTELGFYISPAVRAIVLRQAGESEGT